MFGYFTKAASALNSYFPVGANNSARHFSNASDHYTKAGSAITETVTSTAKAIGNAGNLGIGALQGGVASLTIMSSGQTINLAVQSLQMALPVIAPAALLPIAVPVAKAVSAGVVGVLSFAVYHPLAFFGIGVAAGAALQYDKAYELAVNSFDTTYKVGEALVHTAASAAELGAGTALLAKEKIENAIYAQNGKNTAKDTIILEEEIVSLVDNDETIKIDSESDQAWVNFSYPQTQNGKGEEAPTYEGPSNDHDFTEISYNIEMENINITGGQFEVIDAF